LPEKLLVIEVEFSELLPSSVVVHADVGDDKALVVGVVC